MDILSLTCVMVNNLKSVLFETSIVMTPKGARLSFSPRFSVAWKYEIKPMAAYRANVMTLHSVYEKFSVVTLTRSTKKTSAPKLTNDEWKM